jgi:hypothetical protein
VGRLIEQLPAEDQNEIEHQGFWRHFRGPERKKQFFSDFLNTEKRDALLLGESRHRKLLYSDNLSNDSLSVSHQPRNPAVRPDAFPPNPYVSLQLLATLCTWFDTDQIGLIENKQPLMLNRSAAV